MTIPESGEKIGDIHNTAKELLKNLDLSNKSATSLGLASQQEKNNEMDHQIIVKNLLKELYSLY